MRRWSEARGRGARPLVWGSLSHYACVSPFGWPPSVRTGCFVAYVLPDFPGFPNGFYASDRYSKPQQCINQGSDDLRLPVCRLRCVDSQACQYGRQPVRAVGLPVESALQQPHRQDRMAGGKGELARELAPVWLL